MSANTPYGAKADPGPPGIAAKLLGFCEELRGEGVAVGTSEILDAFAALGEVGWTSRADFREALATTIAKSQDDRRVFELIFDRYFFRTAEAEAVQRGVTEHAEGGDRKPRQVAHLAVVPLDDRLANLLFQLVQVEPLAPLVAAALLADAALYRLGLGGAEEPALEEQLEEPAILLRLGDRRRQGLAEVVR